MAACVWPGTRHRLRFTAVPTYPAAPPIALAPGEYLAPRLAICCPGSVTAWLRLTLLGAGAMNSPRYSPAGLLVRYRRRQAMLDGGPGAEPAGRLAAWLVSDERSELRRDIRALAAARGLRPTVATVAVADLVIEPRPVTHTSHATWGYLLRTPTAAAVWAPEFWEFPAWAEGADLMFADAAGWNRPIRFARGAGGHMAGWRWPGTPASTRSSGWCSRTSAGRRCARSMPATARPSENGASKAAPIRSRFRLRQPARRTSGRRAPALAEQAKDAELFLYPGDQHYFAGSSLPSLESDATALLVKRVPGLLRAVGDIRRDNPGMRITARALNRATLPGSCCCGGSRSVWPTRRGGWPPCRHSTRLVLPRFVEPAGRLQPGQLAWMLPSPTTGW